MMVRMVERMGVVMNKKWVCMVQWVGWCCWGVAQSVGGQVHLAGEEPTLAVLAESPEDHLLAHLHLQTSHFLLYSLRNPYTPKGRVCQFLYLPISCP